MKITHRVAISGMNARPDNPGPGLPVARCLAEDRDFSGRIIGLGYDALDPGLYLGDLCASSHLLPFPSTGEQAYLDRLRAIHAKDPFDVFVPCLDSELALIHRFEKELRTWGVQVRVPDAARLSMRSKERLPELCKAAGVKSPKTKAIWDSRFFSTCAADGWSYPLVVKGVFYDAAIAQSPVEATHHFNRIAADWGYPILVQEIIKGQELNLTGLGDGQGRLLHPVMMSKKALTEKGKAWAGITIHDAGMLACAEKLVKALKWDGPIEVEMMRTPEGEHYLIELNPRFPAWIYLTHGVGVNLPFLWLQMILGRTLRDTAAPAPGTLFIRYAMEQIISLQDFEAMTMNGFKMTGEDDFFAKKVA